jgi:hypothetical protein
MTTSEFTSDDIAEKPSPRKRGSPKGNRNAWKHGERSAAASQARAAARARIIALLPDASVVADSLMSANFVHARLAGTMQNASQSPNKTNNSVASGSALGLRGSGEGLPGATLRSRGEGGGDFSPNKTNNSVSHTSRLPAEAARKRGAPKGNKNALKHGVKSAERRAFKSGLRSFLRRVNSICALAHGIAERRERDGDLSLARGPPKVAVKGRVAIVRGSPDRTGGREAEGARLESA